MNEQSVFIAALEREPAERARFLDQACANHPGLRQRVERLIASHEAAVSFMDEPAGQLVNTVDQSPLESSGAQIGPYKLLQEIGQGGMGVVYLAEQVAPVRRKVALKIIKPGMDTRQVIARFEAERQALSLMDHPNIAKVLDAGTTRTGRPYFVMELVKGQPITEYCDQQHLTTRQRLELFLPVCQAIQHAHQKGVIHRDVKPSNVLVAEYDGRPVAKVIDFGVAKAVSQPLTERTMFTGIGQVVGTLEYMSPEQARVNQLDVDTRSDIYSLGVLLYELLTGSTPISKQRLRSAAWDEMLRIIREEEPPKPSTRLSDSKDSLPSISAQRQTEPAKLTRLVRGELDWIVMKALEKDRNRRYETANGFAADLLRYLADEQVLACPPSTGYRLRKFVRRNKGGLAAATLVLVCIVLLGSGLGWMQRDRSARRATVAGQVEMILTEVDRLGSEQKWPEALATARRAEAVAVVGEADTQTTEKVRARLQDLEFIDRLERIRMYRATTVEGEFDNAGADREYARAFRDHGMDVDALPIETAIDRLKARPTLNISLATALDDWVLVCQSFSKEARWEKLVAMARAIDSEPVRNRLRSSWSKPVSEVADELRQVAESIDIPTQHAATLEGLSRRLRTVQDSDSALRLMREAQSVHPGDFWINFELGALLGLANDHDGAVRFNTAAVSIRPNSAAAHSNLGAGLHNQGKLDDAVAAHRKAIELDPKFSKAHSNLGATLTAQGKLDEALACHYRAIERNPKFAIQHVQLGRTLNALGKLDEAVAAYRKAIELAPKYATAHYDLSLILKQQGKLAQAIAVLERVIELEPDHAARHNELAWWLAAAPEPTLRDPQRAVELAERAVKLQAEDWTYWHTLGVAYYRASKWEESLAALEKSSQLDKATNGKGKAWQWLPMAMAHWKLGDQDAARTRYASGAEWANYHEPRNAELGQLWVEAADLLEIRDDAALHLCRARLHVAQGRWDQAAADYAKYVDSAPGQTVGDHWSEHASALLIVGDLHGYRRACENLVSRFTEKPAPFTAFVLARAGALGVDSGIPAAQLVEWAEQAVASAPESGWYLHVLGLTLYRVGRYEEAMVRLEESAKTQWRPELNHLVLAMAHQRLGHADKARLYWEKVQGQQTESFYASDRTEFEVLQREAEALLMPAPDRPRRHD